MRFLPRAGTALVLTALAIAQLAPSAAQSSAPVVATATAEQLRGAIDAWSATPGHRGVTAAVMFADGSQWSGVAGLAGPDEPLRPEHLLLIASITKTMTAAVILQLADEGVVRLEDPVGRWLLPIRHVNPAITVRQLLNHTNGLANYTANPALASVVAADRGHSFTATELLEFIGSPQFAPGTDTKYTNTAFLLLGLIAERATNRSILELYHQRLWSPLGLTDIFLPAFEEPPGPVAMALSGSLLYEPMNQLATVTVGNSAFGLLSNAQTVARWGQALLGGRVISAAMQTAMRALVPAAGNIPGETGAGLGIRSYEYLGRTQFGHSGGAAMGSSLLLHDPDTGVTVAVVMNQGQGAQHFALAPELLAIATR